MKTLLKMMVLLFTFLPLSIAMGNKNIIGTWEGKLVPAPGTEMKIQFIISQNPDGSYAVVLNTPDEGSVKNVKANEVVYNAGNLKVDVAELSGSYDGVVKDRKIEGAWKQEGTSKPLVLKPYEKPTFSKKDMETLLGTWQGKPLPPEGAILSGEAPIYSFRFEMSEQAEFKGFFTTIDTGMPEQPLTNMGISNGIFTCQISALKAIFKGKLTEQEIVGEFKPTVIANAPGLSLTLVKGEYKAPVYNLNLPKEIKDQLKGEWNGTLTRKMIQTISIAIVFRFENSKNGDFLGFIDMPEEGGSGLPITDADMNEGKLVLKVKTMGGEFAGFISPDKIAGDWKQKGDESTSLTLNRGKYVPSVYTLSLPEETMAQLEGKWNGKFQNSDVTFRFEKVKNGDFKGYANIPMFAPNEKPISDASLSEGKLTLKIKNNVLPVEFTGKLSGDKLVGDLKLPDDYKMPMGNSTYLTLDREKP